MNATLSVSKAQRLVDRVVGKYAPISTTVKVEKVMVAKDDTMMVVVNLIPAVLKVGLADQTGTRMVDNMTSFLSKCVGAPVSIVENAR